MNLIARYIYAVTEQLPEKLREDVAKELRGNIEDMLPENYTEHDVQAALQELGNPWKIAEEYQPRPRYIIGPALYSQYVSVLKLVVGIVISVLIAVTIIGWFFTPSINPQGYLDLFIELLGGTVEGAVHAAVWVTLVFVAIERGWFVKGENNGEMVKGLAEKEWSIDDLPQTPLQARKIPRSGSIASIIATIVFTAVIYVHPGLIGIFSLTSDGAYINYPFLEAERLQTYMPIILLLALAQIILFVWKFIVQYWNIRLWTVHTIISVIGCILLIIMANDPALIREAFLVEAAGMFDVAVSAVQKQRELAVTIFVAIVVVITLWDGLDTFLKARKSSSK